MLMSDSEVRATEVIVISLMPVVTSFVSSTLSQIDRSEYPFLFFPRGVELRETVVEEEMVEGGLILMSSAESVSETGRGRSICLYVFGVEVMTAL